MSDDKKRKEAPKTHCGMCLHEIPTGQSPSACKTCEETLCRNCARQCTACDVAWCAVHYVRKAHFCAHGLSNEDDESEDGKPHALQPYCSEHARVCSECNIALCCQHTHTNKTYSLDHALMHITECNRCVSAICRACSIQCTRCEGYECKKSCAKVVAWENETRDGADYACQNCRHAMRREVDLDSETD